MSYERVRLDTVDGKDLDHLSDNGLPIIDARSRALFVIRRFAIDLLANEVIGTMTYGLRDDLDVSVTLPLVYSRFRLDVDSRRFDPDIPEVTIRLRHPVAPAKT